MPTERNWIVEAKILTFEKHLIQVTIIIFEKNINYILKVDCQKKIF